MQATLHEPCIPIQTRALNFDAVIMSRTCTTTTTAILSRQSEVGGSSLAAADPPTYSDLLQSTAQECHAFPTEREREPGDKYITIKWVCRMDSTYILLVDMDCRIHAKSRICLLFLLHWPRDSQKPHPTLLLPRWPTGFLLLVPPSALNRPLPKRICPTFRGLQNSVKPSPSLRRRIPIFKVTHMQYIISPRSSAT